MRFHIAKALAILTVISAGTAQAGVIITNTFDSGQVAPAGGPGPNGPAVPTVANGVHALGVTFGFTENGLPSANAIYGDSINATADGLTPLTDPLLDGPTDGVLTLSFDNPSTFLQFDIAFTTPVGPGGTVTINGTAQPFTTTPNSGLLQLFSLGSFNWTPAAPFTQATIAFDANLPAGTQFAIDNLSYNDPPAVLSYSTAAAPEPASLALIGGGLVVLGLVSRRRR